MTFLKYMLVIVAYELLSFATGAVGSISMSALGALNPDEELGTQATKLVLIRYVATALAIVAVAWIATRFDAMRKT